MHSIESNGTYWKLLEAHGRLWKIIEAWIPNWWYPFIIECFLHRVLLQFWKVTNDRTNGRTEILKYWVVLCATKNEPHFKFQIKMPLINFHVVWWCLLTNFQWQNNWFNLKKRFTILRNFPDSWYTTRVVGTKINDFMQAPNQAWRIGARVK